MSALIAVDRHDLERLLRAVEVSEGAVQAVLRGCPFALAETVIEAEGALEAAQERGYQRGRDDAEADLEWEAAPAPAAPNKD